MNEEGSQVAATAVDQRRQTATAAAEAGTQVAGAGAGGVRQVASEAASQAGQVTSQATEQARDLVQQAQTQLRDQAGTQAQRGAGGLRDVSQQVRALSEGRSDEAGIAADGARQLAQKIETLAGRVDERGFDGTVDDLRDFARRRPGPFLLGAAAAGFAVSRLGRGLQVVQEQESSAPTTGPAPSGYAPADDAPGAEGSRRLPARHPRGPDAGACASRRLRPDHRRLVMPQQRASQSVAPTEPRQSDKSLGQLVGEMSAELSSIMRAEVQLAKVELKDEVAKAGKAGGMFGAGAVTGYFALLFASLALAWLLDQVMPIALAFFLVAVLYGVAAGVLISRGRTEMKQVDPVPHQTVETLKEDVQWVKAQKS